MCVYLYGGVYVVAPLTTHKEKGRISRWPKSETPERSTIAKVVLGGKVAQKSQSDLGTLDKTTPEPNAGREDRRCDNNNTQPNYPSMDSNSPRKQQERKSEGKLCQKVGNENCCNTGGTDMGTELSKKKPNPRLVKDNTPFSAIAIKLKPKTETTLEL